jgi:molybdopterin/thiamine biosynthesis adenylyltransferase
MSAQLSGRRAVIELEDDHDRYHRQSLITWWDQQLLSDASVLVVGAGALGNELVKNLALLGVGRILVVDQDVVENSNLARCVFFRPEDEGRAKAHVLAERAADLNPDTEIIPVLGDVRMTVGLAVFAEVDLVLGGLDNREARLFVNQACWKVGTPWIDGAIEGLMGVVRVFVPPDGACYECTLSERDHELMAARRTCAMLTREQMLAGRTPTTATTASVVAGMQAQEAVKLLHGERLGPPALAGAGFQFVGLTHDSYIVRYPRREDCLSHDLYERRHLIVTPSEVSFRELLALAQQELGEDAVLELEHEIVVAGHCRQCEQAQTIRRPLDALHTGAGLCPTCGIPWRLELAHTLDESSSLLDCRPHELGLPGTDYVVARSGHERRFFALLGRACAIDLIRRQAAREEAGQPACGVPEPLGDR